MGATEDALLDALAEIDRLRGVIGNEAKMFDITNMYSTDERARQFAMDRAFALRAALWPGGTKQVDA